MILVTQLPRHSAPENPILYGERDANVALSRSNQPNRRMFQRSESGWENELKFISKGSYVCFNPMESYDTEQLKNLDVEHVQPSGMR